MHVSKLIIANILVAFACSLAVAQIVPRNANIVAGEYFLGRDPGEGKATPLTINFVSTTVEIDIPNMHLQTGQTLFVRFKDSNGKWSAARSVPFKGYTLDREQNIAYAEYFIGSDPGLGKGTQVNITSELASLLEIQNINLNKSQIIFLRVKDLGNRWSAPTAVKYPSQIVRAAEILVGRNPATKQPGTGISMTPVDGLFNSAVEEVEATLNSWNRTDTIWVRAQNSDYLWSLPIGEIQIAHPAPVLTSISPTRAGRGSHINITLYGLNFISETKVSFGQDIIVNSTTLKSATELIVYISISPYATTGQRTVIVTNPPPGGGVDSLAKSFTIDTSPPVNVELENDHLPSNFTLSQNYPNPFNPVTKIKYSIPKTSFVNITVYDVLGREIKTLVNEEKTPGNYEVEFNASGLPSGVYFYRILAGSFSETKKLILLK